MTAAEALLDIRGYAAANRFDVVDHVLRRMKQRGVTHDDLQHALTNATACKLQANGRWRVNSVDRDGDALEMIVILEDGVLVVTLF